MKRLLTFKTQLKTLFFFLLVMLFSSWMISAQAVPEVIFDSFNPAGVTQDQGGPPNASVFSVPAAVKITKIMTYHYNNFEGDDPGEISIQDSGGTIYGPWVATGWQGDPTYFRQYAIVFPDIVIPSGTYTVLDSKPSSWSYNDQSNNAGFTEITGDFDVTEPQILPTNKDDCKKNKWATFVNVNTGQQLFKNQGDCVSFIASKRKTLD